MKRNETGKYITREGEVFIEDPQTHEKHLFFIDEKEKLVIRSFLEDDIKDFVSQMDATAKEKRQKIRLLYQELPKKDSENNFFAIEKIVGEKKEDRCDEIYELKRVPIGIGGKSENGLELYIYEKEKDQSVKIVDLLKKVGDYFGIQGDGYIIPYKS